MVFSVLLTIFAATFERLNRMYFWNAEIAAVLVFHINLLDTVLELHFILEFWIL